MYFCGRRSSLIFFGRRGYNVIFITFIRIYRKYHISIYFLRKIIFHFPSKEKILCFRGKKIPSFQIIQERSYFGGIFLKTIFSEHLKKISYHHVFFFEKYHLSQLYKKDHIPVQFFWEDHFFMTSGKRK